MLTDRGASIRCFSFIWKHSWLHIFCSWLQGCIFHELHTIKRTCPGMSALRSNYIKVPSTHKLSKSVSQEGAYIHCPASSKILQATSQLESHYRQPSLGKQHTMINKTISFPPSFQPSQAHLQTLNGTMVVISAVSGKKMFPEADIKYDKHLPTFELITIKVTIWATCSWWTNKYQKMALKVPFLWG